MVQDAESNAEKDKAKRESVEKRNNAESLIHATEKSMEELGGKVSDEDKTATESAISELKAALEGDDVADIAAKTEALQQASMKIGEALYRAQQEGDAEGADPAAASASADDADESASSNDDDVLDADFTVDDEDKK